MTTEGNQVMTGEMLKETLANARQVIAETSLEADTREDIASCLDQIERQSAKAKPSQILIQNNLSSIAALLDEQTLAGDVRERIQALLATLRQLLQPAPAEGVTIVQDVATGGGDFIGRDLIQAAFGKGAVIIGSNARGIIIQTGDGNTITRSVDQVPPIALLQSYYRSLAEECRRLPLGVVDPRFVQPGKQGEVKRD
jgi:hypothetical protein